ncbi:transcriptional regulator [Streptomyces sp. NPDC056374]|uniref:transcriptional regulator n=1 Tax=unclassified Streptomyces TaxID=2593676 RepID=UPI0035DD2530
MNPFAPIDALLATADIPLPAAAERRRLRHALRLEAEPVAQALGIAPDTLNSWEQGSEPAGTARVHYAYFLNKARILGPTEVNRPHPSTRPPHTRASSPARTTSGHHPRPPADDPISDTVRAALDYYDGDRDKATEELVKRAIPHAMRLFNQTRVGARYEIVAYPPMPDILTRSSPDTADQIWEARPNWERPGGPTDGGPVTVLDINGAYLSALKAHLPLGALQHQTGAPHDRRRSGVYRITPPQWDHGNHLPNPLGHRLEPGSLWITEPTMRLLLQLSTSPAPLCAPPVIHESYTSGATEGLLEKFRALLRDARSNALQDDDEVTLAYVKSMYSKFVSTMGDSNYNRELHRPDWMHIIRAQAFANLWRKAHSVHTAGLTVVRLRGTDELHVQGEWGSIFAEGRGLNEVKIKTAGEGSEAP